MKWVSLLIFIAVIIPLPGWLRHHPRHVPKIWMLVGFLPFVLQPLHLYMAFISWAEWPGYVKGVEFTVLDALVLALYFALPRVKHPQALPFRFSMAFYFLVVLASAFTAGNVVAALFYPWQLLRIFLLRAVISRACADPRIPFALLQGMAAGLIMEAGVTLYERIGQGALQAAGTFDHQNELGMISHFVVFPFFALLISRRRGWLPLAVALAGIVVELLTTSRGTIGIAGFGYAIVFLFSVLQRWTRRKVVILALGVATVALLTPLAISSLAQRGDRQIEDSDDERVVLKSAAAAMFSDYPMGVGANNFVVTANIYGYYKAAGLGWASYGATVHNVYWLVAAETGFLGFVGFVFYLVSPLIVAVRCAQANRGDQRGDLLIGLGVALFAVYVQSFVEWIFITFQLQYMFAIETGIVAGLATQMHHWRRISFAPYIPPTARSKKLIGSKLSGGI